MGYCQWCSNLLCVFDSKLGLDLKKSLSKGKQNMMTPKTMMKCSI